MTFRNKKNHIVKTMVSLYGCLALNAAAGTAAPSQISPQVETKPKSFFESISATVDAAYDSRYYFRGLWFADNIAWGALNLSIPITEKLTWGVGGAYINTLSTPYPTIAPNGPSSDSGFRYSEVDAVTSLTYNAGWAKFGMQYQYYFYPDHYAGMMNGVPNAGNDPEFGIKGAGELGWTMAVPIKAFNFYAGYYYDFRISGHYFQLGADYTIPVTDRISIVPSVNMGYGIDYYTGNNASFNSGSVMTRWNGQPLGPKSGFTHFLYTIAVPIRLTNSITLTTYVAMNQSERLRTGLNATRNEIWWGTKLSFTF